MTEESNWSLKQEIKKRKTQTMLRTMEAKQMSTVKFTGLPERKAEPPKAVTPAKQWSKTLQLANRTTQVTRITEKIPVKTTSKRTTQVTKIKIEKWSKRQKRTAAIGVFMVIVVAMVSALIAFRQPTLGSAGSPLPVVNTRNVVDYLRGAGVPITSVRSLSGQSAVWNARDELEFHVESVADKGVFLVLSYDSPNQAGIDAFNATYDSTFKDWNLVQIANVLFLTAPNSAQTLRAEIASHLMRYLVAPYRSFIPTPDNKR